jgi:hypothetical protein
MFFKYLDPLLKPFRDARGKVIAAQSMKGNVKVDINRVKNLGKESHKAVAGAAQKVGGAYGHVAGGAQQAMQQSPGAPGGAPGAPGAIHPNPPIALVGLIFKKKVCTQCSQQLDKTWDSCPYCAQAAAAAMAASAKPQKTVAFVLDGAGNAGMQLLGWIVPITGPQRGELYALSPSTTIGKDPSCTIVLQDGYMSSRHAEIKAEGGLWLLKDLGSTNGTYVNDKRVDKHELVDNDVVMFGKCTVKFKSL